MMFERHPRLCVSVVIEDRVSKRAVMRSLLLTPQQLEAYRGQLFVATAKTLTARLLVDSAFLEFLEKADPLWRNILFEYPQGQRGLSRADDPLVNRYCDEEIGMSNEAFHKQCFERFGGEAAEIQRSPYFLTEMELTKFKNPHGVVLVVATGDPDDMEKCIVHQTVSGLIPLEVANDIAELILLGKVALPATGTVYGKYTVDWATSNGWIQDRAKNKLIREQARAEACRMIAEHNQHVAGRQVQAKLSTIKTSVEVAPGAR